METDYTELLFAVVHRLLDVPIYFSIFSVLLKQIKISVAIKVKLRCRWFWLLLI